MTEKDGAGSGEGTEEFSLIPRKTLLALHDGLVRARERRGEGKRARGWKYVAAAVAVAQDLLPGDWVIAEGPVPALGGSLSVSGRGAGGPLSAQVSKSERPGAPTFAAELERAAGVALRHKTKKSGKVVVVFGGGAGEAWRDALEVARAHRLPMVFVTELREGRDDERGPKLEPGTELARIVVDGNDAVGSYRVAHEAIDRARRGRGATLVECAAFRVKGSQVQDPVAMMKAYLRAKGIGIPGS